MRLTIRSQGSALVILAIAGLLSSCGPTQAERQAEEMRIAAIEAAAIAARLPAPVALNDSVALSAAVYVAFSRDMATIRGGFASPAEVQAALRRGAASDPIQISRGLVAYASILALQSPEFVSGVRQAGAEPDTRRQIIDRIVADPAYAATLPGAEAAASLVVSVLETEIAALSAAADSVESDAYNIQYAGDQRNVWGRATVDDREGRLQTLKDLSRPVLASAAETARLYEASNGGTPLEISANRTRRPPYAPSVTNALAMAALASLGVAGENAVANTDALQFDRASQDCLSSAKLNLFQCMAAARPTYEDMFCLGRHVIRDLSTCARGAALPTAIITVGNPTQSGPRGAAPERSPTIEPRAIPTPALPTPPTAREPAIDPAPLATPTPTRAPSSPALTPTQRLNSGPNG